MSKPVDMSNGLRLTARRWGFETSLLFSPAERAALRLGYHAALVPSRAIGAVGWQVGKHGG